MARPFGDDFLMAFRFHVTADDTNGRNYLQVADNASGAPQAGFSNVTAPNVTTEAAEYREGHYIYTRKYPGLPTVEDMTMSRGVALQDTSFWSWMRVVVEGGGEYRSDLTIKHYHREAVNGRTYPANGTGSPSEFIDQGLVARTYRCFDCFPTSCKMATDFEATSAEVSVSELGVAVERVDLNPDPTQSLNTGA